MGIQSRTGNNDVGEPWKRCFENLGAGAGEGWNWRKNSQVSQPLGSYLPVGGVLENNYKNTKQVQ